MFGSNNDFVDKLPDLRVQLNKDLTAYGIGLVVGARGWTKMHFEGPPRCPCGGVWVRFDCGRSLEVLMNDDALIVLDPAYLMESDIRRQQRVEDEQAHVEAMKKVKKVTVHLSKTDGFQKLVYFGPDYESNYRSRGPNGLMFYEREHQLESAQKGRRLWELFKSYGVPIEVIGGKPPRKSRERKTV